MRRVRLIIEYDGTDYCGWQIQPNGTSVQEVLERELSAITGESVRVHGSGRTDSGVHAYAQVLHFDTNSGIPADKFPYALNAGLPMDIRVLYGDEPASPDFHARFGVRKKSYRYTIYNAPHASAFCYRTALHEHRSLDMDAMRYAAQAVLGEHNFAAFKSEGVQLKSTVREIYRSEWIVDGNFLYYEICGSGFMYNMVRILVGTMLDIGKGYISSDSIEVALQTHNRENAGATAPARGLAMTRVEYDDFDTQKALLLR